MAVGRELASWFGLARQAATGAVSTAAALRLGREAGLAVTDRNFRVLRNFFDTFEGGRAIARGWDPSLPLSDRFTYTSPFVQAHRYNYEYTVSWTDKLGNAQQSTYLTGSNAWRRPESFFSTQIDNLMKYHGDDVGSIDEVRLDGVWEGEGWQ